MQNIRRVTILSISLLPTIFYKSIPILKDNADWRIRGVLTIAMIIFPYKYN